ncbi:MAG: hypothetical protein WD646_04295, partial [Actinomycetota bacterium]
SRPGGKQSSASRPGGKQSSASRPGGKQSEMDLAGAGVARMELAEAEGVSNRGPASSSSGRKGSRKDALYLTPGDAHRAVQDGFNYWTGRLTDSSFHLSLAVIAANWAAFRSIDGVLAEPWAKTSIAIVLANLALNLVGAKVLGNLHLKQAKRASRDPIRWKRDADSALASDDPWPFTECIETVASAMREVKTWFPFVAGAALLVAVLVN